MVMLMSEKKTYKTEQEEFWAGNFGTDYIQRNQGSQLLASNLAFFSKALRSTSNLKKCIEFGANIGMNLLALKMLYPNMDLHGIEINESAVAELRALIPEDNVYHESILNFEHRGQWDLVLVKGVLIHINPDEIQKVYDKMVSACSRYLLIAEYYNPTPVSIPYRGHANRLFKRDFAGEIMDIFPEMKLADYGFAYKRDPDFPQDDINWFLLRRD
jgi:spore coat polysaccharide biosynthesis protein SpsF